MSTEIYYFSGTGNSLHAAREIQGRLPGSELIPIVRLLRADGPIASRSDCAGIVFPNFCLTVPIPVREFVKKVDFSSTNYLFAVCTRGGSPSQAFRYIDELLENRKKKLNAFMNITMPWNHPIGKEDLVRRNTPERMEKLEARLQAKADEFCHAVLASRDWLEPDTEADLGLSAGIEVFEALITKSFNYSSHDFFYQKCVRFFADGSCSGCGQCEKVCLNQKIEMAGGRPRWKKDVRCYACFACINSCPQQAIQVSSNALVKSATDVNGRYHHPGVTWKEIAAQR